MASGMNTSTRYLKPIRLAPMPATPPSPARPRDLAAPSLQHQEKSIFRSQVPLPEDPAELKLWQRRFQNQLGVSSTLQDDEKDRFARAYLEQLVDQLGGEDIRARQLEVRVELFSGDLPQAALDDSNQREREWESQNPGREWPVRLWLGAEPGDKPLYRLAITKGLLDSLDTREEVAFVLSSLLERLFEEHRSDPENLRTAAPTGNNWVNSRQRQIANDSRAIARMSRANLNPQGALQALGKLYQNHGPQYSGDDQRVSLQAVLQVQEHEGVRFSALQGQVEQMRRQGHPSTQTGSELLPKEQLPQATGQYQSQLENFAAFQLGLQQLADQLSGPETPAWMFHQGPSPVTALKAMGPGRLDYEAALMALCDQLQQSNKPPQQQVDGFLRVLLAFEGDLLELSPASRQRAQEFLQAHQSSWQPQLFLDSLSSQQGQSLHRRLASQLLRDPDFQSLVEPLPGPFHQLVGSASEHYLKQPENGESDLLALADFLQPDPLQAHPRGPLEQLVEGGVLELLAAQSPQALAARPEPASGLPIGLVLGNRLRSLKLSSQGFAGQLRLAMGPLESAANAVRENHARLRLRPPLSDSSSLSLYLQEFFASEQGQGFTPAFEEQLPGLLRDLIVSCNHQGHLVYDSGIPRPLEAGLERRLCSMAAAGDGEALHFLSRHWSHELRLPTHSPRRQWTAQAAQALATRPLETTPSQPSLYAETLRQALVNTFQLSGEALPDVSDDRLQQLDERRRAGEFEPRPEHFANPADYQAARQAYEQRCRALAPLAQFVAGAEARQVLAPLAILGHQPELSLEVASRLKPEEFTALLARSEQAVERAQLVRDLASQPALEGLGADAGCLLMDGFLAVEPQIGDLDEFWSLARRTVQLAPLGVEARGHNRSQFAASLYGRLQQLELPQLRQWLAKDFVKEALKPEQLSPLVHKILGEVGPETPLDQLANRLQELDTQYRLRQDFPAVFASLRDGVVESCKLQPGNLDALFPPEPADPVALIQRMPGQLAGLSGLVAMTRNHPPDQQLATVEYLMGRADDMPAFLEKAAEDQSLGPVAEALRSARRELLEADPAARVLVANSFLSGPRGLMNTAEGKKVILDFVLRGVDPKFLTLARPMVHAVLYSQGDAESLAMAMVLGSKPRKEGDKRLTEADILNKVFDSYGVPGVKMKQYLAFTSQFEHLRETFESAQDAANPLNYYEVLRLIQHRFGSEWPADLVVDRTLGSGSVNVAIRYFNQAKGCGEVVSLGREHIEEATRYDFARFHKFVDALTSTPEGEANFGFVRGLVGIIQESVELEFDKEAAQKVQHQAFNTYQHTFEDGWSVRSIDAFKAENLGLFMEEASGKTARKLFTSNRPLYNEAMAHMAETEFRLLKGQDASNNVRPLPNFANPDFHDGQVLIDEAKKQVTILDFGQAVPISNEEREAGLDLLTVLGRLDTNRQAIRRLNQRFFPPGAPGISKEDLEKVWDGPDLQINGHKSFKTKTMDRFIRLLAAISQKGGKVPLATVHWVLALNRQVSLGDKLDQGIKLEVAGMVANHKLGLPLSAYNLVHDTTEAALDLLGDMTHGLARWALPFLF